MYKRSKDFNEYNAYYCYYFWKGRSWEDDSHRKLGHVNSSSWTQSRSKDADIGLRNLDLLLGLENRILYTAMDILDGQCRLDQAMIRDKR